MFAVYIAGARVADGYTAAGILALAGVAAIVWFERVCPAGQSRAAKPPAS
jgi:hypothetical protein